jgi:hypothetical protein
MTRGAPISETVTLHVPYRVVKRGGRKEMQLPDGVQPDRKSDSTLVKALARVFRWKRMLEAGEFATIAELAEREGIAPSYMTRVLRLTQLETGIIEAVLNGRQARHHPRPINGAVSTVLERAEERRLPSLITSLRTSRATAAIASLGQIGQK